jgi:hypothetical protein
MRERRSFFRKRLYYPLEVEIKDVDSFTQRIAGCHHTLVAGNYNKAVYEAMLRMNDGIIGPSDLSSL